jgi:hypothetical protein
MTPRRVRALFFALVVLPITALVARVTVGCGQLTPADHATIAADGVRIATCQAMTFECKRTSPSGEEAKCWGVYDRCMVGAGLSDAAIAAAPRDATVEAAPARDAAPPKSDAELIRDIFAALDATDAGDAGKEGGL